ncbi:MAG: hypothetical protein A4S09_09325 [Proteobacteria bacterium SG_bin7]|nr:MAG: hypothetical protein A4S09_09325 [Proteobacteria bacterium SG_bin7]
MDRIVVLLILSVFFFFGEIQAQDLEVITFNTALARALGHDYNPCVLSRLEALIQYGIKPSSNPQVLMFQEVFSLEARNRLVRWAEENNYNYTKIYSQRTGLVTLTNLPIRDERFNVFSCQDSFIRNFGTHNIEVRFKNHLVQVVNTHTYYSDGKAPGLCHVHNLSEIAERLNKIKGPRIFAGDINSGPNVAFFDEVYNQVKSNWEPFLAKMTPKYNRLSTDKITWDISNPLSRPFSDPTNLSSAQIESHLSSTLDHLFASPEIKLVSTDLVFNMPVPVNGCSNYEVEPGKTYLSDHYGVSTVVTME